MAALALVVLLLSASGARAKRGSPMVLGYPYSGRCPGAGIADVVDRWHMYACNCTSYVAWALTANHQRIDWFVPGAMDAWNWPNVARHAGLHVDRIPAVGAVVAWPKLAQPFGHVAYVIGIETGGRIDVAEYNLPVLGEQTFASIRSEVATDAAQVLHVDTVVALTLGTAWRAAKDERFDGRAAAANLAFFRPGVIPTPPGTMPPGVTEVRFVSDLSSCPPVSADAQWVRSGLLAAATRRRSRLAGANH